MGANAELKDITVEGSAATWERRLAQVREHAPGTAFESLCTAWLDYYVRAARAREKGEKLAWVSFFAPIELLHAFDVVPFNPEQHILASLARGATHELFDLGEGTGFSKLCCSPHMAAVGAARAGLLPRPDFLFSTTPPCDSSGVMFKTFQHFTGVPGHVIDIPYRADPEAVAYLAAELRDAAAFLGEQTGLRLDLDRLREGLRLANGIHRHFCRIGGLRRIRPSLLGGRLAFSLISLKYMSDGTEPTLRYFEALEASLREQVEHGNGPAASPRRRIIWSGSYPFFHMKLLDWIEQEFDAVILTVLPTGDYLLSGDAEWDLSDPFAALARKMHFYSGCTVLGGPFRRETYYDGLLVLCREMNVSAHIFFASLGCPQYCGTIRLFRDALRREAGVPTLVVDGDTGDSRVTSVEQMKVRIREFFRMLEATGH